MGSTPLIHFGEHILRALVGVAFVGMAEISAYPNGFKWAGWFLILSSLIIMIAPRRWHHSYALYWSKKLSPATLRGLSILPIIFGLWLLSEII